MFSRGRSEGDGDEGSKQLIERDKVDIEHSVCARVMNVSNKMCLYGNVEEDPSRTYMMLRGSGGFLLLWFISCYLACMCVWVHGSCLYVTVLCFCVCATLKRCFYC